MPWADARIQTTAVLKELDRTLKLSAKYCRTLKKSLHKLLSMPGLPEFPKSQWKTVMQNGFVDYPLVYRFIDTDLRPTDASSMDLGRGYKLGIPKLLTMSKPNM